MTNTTQATRSGVHKLPRSLFTLNGVGFEQTQLWWLAFVMGVGCILVAGLADSPFMVGLALPLLVMMFYWLVGRRLPRNSEARQSFADSLYYLGFLFTLTALAAALFFLARPGLDWGEEVRNQLISRFGLALGTTILGLALRVTIVGIPSDASGSVEAAEEALERSLDNFRDQLDLQIDRLGILTDKQVAIIGTATEESFSILSSRVQHAGDALEAAVRKMTESLESAGDSYSDTLQARTSEMVLPDAQFRSHMEQPLRDIASTTDELHREIKNSVAAQRAISRSAKRMADNYESVTDASEAMTTFVDVGAETVREMNNMLESFRQISTAIGAVAPATLDTSRAITKGAEEIANVSSALAHTLADAQNTANTVAAQTEMISTHNKALENMLERSRVATDRVQSDLVDAVATIRHAVKRPDRNG